MTPEQCRELAEFHEQTASELLTRAVRSEGVVGAALHQIAQAEIEAARYWREKANG